MNSNEWERIQQVYQGYSDANLGGTRWSASNAGNRLIGAERQALAGQLLNKYGFAPLGERRVLDIGCGNGDVLASFCQWGAQPKHLYGLKLLPQRAAAAHSRYPDLHIMQGNAAMLGFDTGVFDLILFFTVFSSVLNDDLRQTIATEALRILKPGGAIIWYDLRIPNPGNANVKPLGRKELQSLFPSLTLDLQATTLLPPLARRLGKATELLYPRLSRLGWLRTHYVGLLTAAGR